MAYCSSLARSIYGEAGAGGGGGGGAGASGWAYCCACGNIPLMSIT